MSIAAAYRRRRIISQVYHAKLVLYGQMLRHFVRSSMISYFFEDSYSMKWDLMEKTYLIRKRSACLQRPPNTYAHAVRRRPRE